MVIASKTDLLTVLAGPVRELGPGCRYHVDAQSAPDADRLHHCYTEQSTGGSRGIAPAANKPEGPWPVPGTGG